MKPLLAILAAVALAGCAGSQATLPVMPTIDDTIATQAKLATIQDVPGFYRAATAQILTSCGDYFDQLVAIAQRNAQTSSQVERRDPGALRDPRARPGCPGTHLGARRRRAGRDRRHRQCAGRLSRRRSPGRDEHARCGRDERLPRGDRQPADRRPERVAGRLWIVPHVLAGRDRGGKAAGARRCTEPYRGRGRDAAATASASLAHIGIHNVSSCRAAVSPLHRNPAGDGAHAAVRSGCGRRRASCL